MKKEKVKKNSLATPREVAGHNVDLQCKTEYRKLKAHGDKTRAQKKKRGSIK